MVGRVKSGRPALRAIAAIDRHRLKAGPAEQRYFSSDRRGRLCALWQF
jgi:hypothetical protein